MMIKNPSLEVLGEGLTFLIFVMFNRNNLHSVLGSVKVRFTSRVNVLFAAFLV